VALLLRDGDRDAFIARSPTPFLLYRTTVTPEAPRAFKTAMALPVGAVELARAGFELADDMSNIVLLTVEKAPGSPWQQHIIVGRARNSDVCVDEPSISKVHAHITSQAAGEFWLADAGSRNGTWVQDKRVGKNAVRLTLGAKLKLGDVSLEFVDAGFVFDFFRDKIHRSGQPGP
jgi:hypothetical protein